MIRIIIFFLLLVFVVSGVTIFVHHDSRIVGEAFGYRFDGPAGLVVGAFVLTIAAAIYFTHLYKSLTTMSSRLKAKEREAKRNRGVSALTRGLEAVAAGDAPGAAHHAKVARNSLEDVELTRLLTAQAAQLNKDEATARESFSAMLEAPETEFLGLKGLYLQSMAAGDTEKARGFADRAFRLRPNANWAFDTVFDLGLKRGAWGETRDALSKARKNGIVDNEKANRAIAVLLTADAYAAQLSDDKTTALTEAQSALKKAPGFAPAATLAATLLTDAGKKGKAGKLIETTFAVAAHPALVKTFEEIIEDQSDDKKAASLEKLADKNSSADEAILLRARAAMLRGEWQSAMTALEPVLSKAPAATPYAMMAEAVAGEYGVEASRPWLEKAAQAPLDPRPGAEGTFHFTRDGWARLVREYMEFERLAPPPLEEASLGMSIDDIRLLAAPPEKPAEEPEAPASEEAVGAEAALKAESETQDSDAANADVKPPSPDVEPADTNAATTKEPTPADGKTASAADTPSDTDASTSVASSSVTSDEDDRIHNDEEAERAAAAARNVS